MLGYFERIRSAEETGEEGEEKKEFLSMCVSFSRHKMDSGDAGESAWRNCEKKLLSFESMECGVIESADGCLQVDFANEYFGGGVLDMGCVQVHTHSLCLVFTFFFFCRRRFDL